MTETDRQVAIVTGAARGIGAGIVAAYRERGWAVVAADLTPTPVEDPDLVSVAGDISVAADAARVLEEAQSRFGHVDTLVNNAGVYISKPFTDYSADDYATVVGVNLTGFFILTQLAIREMLSRGGHVVNITSTVAEYADSATPAVLAGLTKGGVASATKSLAIEYARHGIRVNAVSPGVVQTPLHAADTYDTSASRTPLGRVAQIADIVRGIMFLEASPFITGEVLHIDGGRSAGH